MNYQVLKEKYGSDVDELPLGAIGLYNVTDKIKVGLQQLMAGSRNWKVEYISRDDHFFSDRGVRQNNRYRLRHGCVSARKRCRLSTLEPT